MATLRRIVCDVLRNQLAVSSRAVSTSAKCRTSSSQKRAKYFPAKTMPMLLPDTFAGKTAFITGGGTGLGKGMARMLSNLGANVCIVSRKMDILQNTADLIAHDTGNKTLAVQCDVRDPLAVKEAVSDCVHAFGLPTLIVNNAAGNFIAPTERLSSNAWKTIVDIVLNGTANVTLDIGKRLINAREGASFLNISTVYTTSGSGFVVASAAAKAGVEALTKSLASEWSRYGMRFNCIAPGPIETKGAMTNRGDPKDKFLEAEIRKIAAGRVGTKEEHANLACYLLSDYASWMTGQIIHFDGGEFNFMAGEFNSLMDVSKEEWDMMEATIRKLQHIEIPH